MSDQVEPIDPNTRAQTPDDVARILPRLAVGLSVPDLSSWIMEKQLGSGGFGEVWLVKHEFTDARRAVKFCTDPVARNRLITHEKKVVARVMKHAGNHPNIVPLLEHNLDGAIPWLMYEFVEGGTLADVIDSWKPLSVPERIQRAVRMLHTLAGALATFHRLDPPIVHRDMKPQNVLMAGEVPRITDFGIGGAAVEAAVSESKTRDSIALPSLLRASGSLKYASPEQTFGSPPNPRDDVFSLGVIAYQMLVADTRYPPGTDANDELSELNIPRELISLIVKSVALNAERRPKDAGAWETALAAFLPKPSPVPVASTAPAERRWQVTVPGTWYSRPAEKANAEWTEVVLTPAEITTRPGEVYRLDVSSSTDNAALAGLAHLKELNTLQTLEFKDCDKVTNAGLAHLKGLTALQTLNLYDCKEVTDAGLAHLKGLTALQTLDLSFAKVTDAGLAHLRELTALQTLDLYGCKEVTDAGLAHLKELTALQTLNLSSCNKVTDAGLAHLKELTALQRLRLYGCKEVTDAGLTLLKELTALQMLDLSYCKQITDTGLAHLKSLTALQALDVNGCKLLTDAGVWALKKALPNCKVYR